MEKENIMAPSINIENLCRNSIDLIQYARQIAAKQVNMVQLMTYYSIGRWIVEEQQQGQSRAQYLSELSGSNFRNTVSEICNRKIRNSISGI